MIVVSDTSPLCNLALVEHLWLLREIYQTVIIPNRGLTNLQQNNPEKWPRWIDAQPVETWYTTSLQNIS